MLVSDKLFTPYRYMTQDENTYSDVSENTARHHRPFLLVPTRYVAHHRFVFLLILNSLSLLSRLHHMMTLDDIPFSS